MALFPDEIETRTRVLKSMPSSLQHNFLDALGIGLDYLRKRRKDLKP